MKLSRETQQSNAEINKFVMLGAATILLIGAGLFGLRTYVKESQKNDSLEAPWIVAARGQHGTSQPVTRTLNAPQTSPLAAVAGTPPASQEVQEAIARWRRENGQ